MNRYALWIHAIDTDGTTKTNAVTKFWPYDGDEEARRELVKEARREVIKPGIGLVHYNIRHENSKAPFARGTLFSEIEREQKGD
jgi:hypothetical protein